ncbi:MAG TPA: alkaline phosphatase family protein [Thermoplasmata archaeon]|nr:alkaline phosphatase family protein [Thermoplasmata archaeon]
MAIGIVLVLVGSSAVGVYHVESASSPALLRPAGVPSTVLTHSTSASFPTPIQHVVVVMDENQNYSRVLAGGPFEAYLAKTYGTATNDYSILRGSDPAYMAATSGFANRVFPQNVTNLGDLADAAGVTWAAFEQSMPVPCDTTRNWTAGYDPNHNPFVLFNDTVRNTTRCDAHDLTWSSWTADVSAGALPNYSFVTPNLTNDESNSSLPVGDAWLQSWLSPLINNSAIFSNTAFLITYDENGGNSPDTPVVNGTTGGQVYMVVVSPYSHQLSSGRFYTTYSLLTTAEWLLGIPGGTLGNDSWALHPPLMDLFCFVSCTTAPPKSPSGLPFFVYALIGLVLAVVAIGFAAAVLHRRGKAPPPAVPSPVGGVEVPPHPP